MTALGALQSTVLAQDATREDRLRSWLTERIDGHNLTGNPDEGVELEWTLTTTTLMSGSDIDRKWKAVKNYPDHPDRNGMIYHRQLLKTPDVMTGELAFCDARSWLETTGRNTDQHLERGGFGDIRWMLYNGQTSGQLTVIRAGVDYPSVYNVSAYYDEAKRRIDHLLNFGLGSIADDAKITRLKVGAGTWTADIYEKKFDRTTSLTGDWDAETNEPLVHRWRTPSIEREGWTDIRFERFTFIDALNTSIPLLISKSRPDGIKQVYRINSDSIERIGRGVLNDQAKIPKVPEDVNFMDFRTAKSAKWETHSQSRRATWTQTKATGVTTDSYSVEDPISSLVVIAGQAAPAAPSSGTPWMRFIAIGLVVCCVVGIPILVHKKLR